LTVISPAVPVTQARAIAHFRRPVAYSVAAAILSLLLTDVEKALQLRSRLAQTVNVRKTVRLGLSLAAALLDDLLNIRLIVID
jgi:hypothetical protein